MLWKLQTYSSHDGAYDKGLSEYIRRALTKELLFNRRQVFLCGPYSAASGNFLMSARMNRCGCCLSARIRAKHKRSSINTPTFPCRIASATGKLCRVIA